MIDVKCWFYSQQMGDGKFMLCVSVFTLNSHIHVTKAYVNCYFYCAMIYYMLHLHKTCVSHEKEIWRKI
jgi:hypothetical protein